MQKLTELKGQIVQLHKFENFITPLLIMNRTRQNITKKTENLNNIINQENIKITLPLNNNTKYITLKCT